MNQCDTAVLTVSFGTSYEKTRKRTIDQIEKEIAETYPQYSHYQAWTSPKIRRKLKERDGIIIPGITESLQKIQQDGIRNVVIQPTFLLKGIESELAASEIEAFQEQFETIVLARPLLESVTDQKEIVEATMAEYHPEPSEILIFMGHGTEHEANYIYRELESLYHKMGYENVLFATVEEGIPFEKVLKTLKEKNAKKIMLAPFMIVAGDHAANDMAGSQEDSWKSQLESRGYPVDCCLKGLGEFKEIRQIFLRHTKEALKKR